MFHIEYSVYGMSRVARGLKNGIHKSSNYQNIACYFVSFVTSALFLASFKKYPQYLSHAPKRISTVILLVLVLLLVLALRLNDRPGSLFQPGPGPGPGSAKSAGTGILPGPGL